MLCNLRQVEGTLCDLTGIEHFQTLIEYSCVTIIGEENKNVEMKNDNKINLPKDEIFNESLEDYIRVAFEPVSLFLELLEKDEENDHKYLVATSLYEHALKKMADAFEVVGEQVGQVSLKSPCFNNSGGLDYNCILSAHTVPKKWIFSKRKGSPDL